MAYRLPPDLIERLRGRRIVALTGAGCSTESGIPDYRGEGTRARARRPIQFQAFVDDPLARRRYWARAWLGWPKFAGATPNAGHIALARLEQAGLLVGVITQNVDGLHQQAGNRRVVELHGSLREVRCLGCGAMSSRQALQDALDERNAEVERSRGAAAPDGDLELQDVPTDFTPIDCEACGGLLKPHVVFFGETVPATIVDDARALLGGGEALLVLGTSLAVFSGYRFVRAAHERGMPVAIVNRGTSRADALASVRVDERLGLVLPELATALIAGPAAGDRSRSVDTTRT